MRHEFIATVEAHTGREVESFTSGVDVDHAIATETFVLVPLPDEPAEPSRRDDLIAAARAVGEERPHVLRGSPCGRPRTLLPRPPRRNHAFGHMFARRTGGSR